MHKQLYIIYKIDAKQYESPRTPWNSLPWQVGGEWAMGIEIISK